MKSSSLRSDEFILAQVVVQGILVALDDGLLDATVVPQALEGREILLRERFFRTQLSLQIDQRHILLDG